nr:DEAD box ATP dependent RNA helicase [Hymenolepis microstoma]
MGVQYFIIFLFIVATLANDVSNVAQRYSGCDLEQKGFHLKLRCSLTPGKSGSYDACYFGVDIAKDAFANPYEVSDKLPELKFTITRRASQSKGRLFGLLPSEKPVEYESTQEIAINSSNIDIEAPSWKSESNRWKFSFDSQLNSYGSDAAAIELSIPLHLRYNLPSRNGNPKGGFVAKAFSERCEALSSELGVFSGIYHMGCSSDLLLVMPLTVILLVIGIFVLALHH